MKKSDLNRKVRVNYYLIDASGFTPSMKKTGEDIGLFKSWSTSKGEPVAIVEIDKGKIIIHPAEDIEFLD